jgi:hypothetical protein
MGGAAPTPAIPDGGSACAAGSSQPTVRSPTNNTGETISFIILRFTILTCRQLMFLGHG